MDGPEMDALLKQIGWTPQVVAGRLGVRTTTIYDWLTGRRSIPPNLGDWLRQVAHAIDQAPALPDGWRSGGDC
jgi:hypothetical protein